MLSNIITYLFIGVIWTAALDFVNYIIQSNVELRWWEKLINILVWPFTFVVFSYHFIKSIINGG
jgi:TM2 domain-containing membrane protein YozV